MAGQTRSVSVTGRSLQFRVAVGLFCRLRIQHFIKFVADNVVRKEPRAKEEKNFFADTNSPLKCLIEDFMKTTPEYLPSEVTSGSVILKSKRRSSETLA